MTQSEISERVNDDAFLKAFTDELERTLGRMALELARFDMQIASVSGRIARIEVERRRNGPVTIDLAIGRC